ncbi:MAG TPA: ElyC/SanA/YdcF family protein [Herpetosiphonaceae bacterium]
MRWVSIDRLKRALKRIGLLALIGALLLAGLNGWVLASASGRIYSDLAAVPANDVGLLLGTSSRVADGRGNIFFHYRVEAAARLYHAGKIRAILASGDNSIKEYDEPSAMREALLKLGVPDAAITLDYAGFRTLDSVVRAKDVFGATSVTIITDDFHAPRAVFLSRQAGLEAIAFQSEPVPFGIAPQPRIREVGARVKAWLDVFILDTQPAFRGPREVIKGLEQPGAGQQGSAPALAKETVIADSR